MPKQGIQCRNGNTDVVTALMIAFKVIQFSDYRRHKCVLASIMHLGWIGLEYRTAFRTNDKRLGQIHILLFSTYSAPFQSYLTASVKLLLGYDGWVWTGKSCSSTFKLASGKEFGCKKLMNEPNVKMLFRTTMLILQTSVLQASFT